MKKIKIYHGTHGDSAACEILSNTYIIRCTVNIKRHCGWMPEISLGTISYKDWLIYTSSCLCSGYEGGRQLSIHVVPEMEAVRLLCQKVQGGCARGILPLSLHVNIVTRFWQDKECSQ